MELVFLGTGSAFTVGENFNSNAILVHPNGKRFLIDCGSDARHSLDKLGLTHSDISDVYISHLHADHAGGLEWLAFRTMFDPKCNKPGLYIHEGISHSIWENVLSGGLSSLKDMQSELSTYFNVHVVKGPNNQFSWENIPFQLVQTEHAYNCQSLMSCYGLFFTAGKTKIYFTADTTYTPDKLMMYYEDADLIFHDCETTSQRTQVHAHFDELSQLPPAIKKKMYLYHYNVGALPDEKAQGFKGFVKPGDCFTL